MGFYLVIIRAFDESVDKGDSQEDRLLNDNPRVSTCSDRHQQEVYM